MSKPTRGSALSQGGLSELKQRLLFVLIGIFVFRLGAHIPVPGLNLTRLSELFHQHSGGVLGLFNMFSGGALSRLTVFALGVMPYISASIIIQLFTFVVPHFEQLKKEGEQGQRKINQYTRYGALGLALFQAMGISIWLTSQKIVLVPGLAFYCLSTVTLAVGTMALMWLGEQMTERGIGNGVSLIIFSGIISRFPQAVGGVLNQFKQGQMPAFSLILLLAVVAGVTYFVVFVERGQRRITVNYANRQQGRRTLGSPNSHLPLKINMAGVIPPIFATSIIMFPATLAQLFGKGKGMHWLSEIGLLLSPGQPVYMLFFALAIVFFCFFYTALVFDPKDTANNLKKSGAFISGIRPGQQTADYIDKIMTRLTLAGAMYLVMVALLPEFLIVAWRVPFYFGGTSLLIVVVVIMDFISQIQAYFMSHQYESLMRKANLKLGTIKR